MKRIIYLICLIAISSTAFSQTDIYDLSQYKLPELKRNTLEFGFDLRGAHSLQKLDQDGAMEEIDRKYKTYSNNMSITYRHFYSSSKFQRLVYANLNNAFDYNSYHNDDDLEREDYSYLPSLDLSFENRYYFRPRLFLETDFLLRCNYRYDYRKQKGSKNNRESKDFHTDAYLPIKIGLGRIEPVNDARHALYLFDELVKQKRISSIKSADEVTKFAEFISELKNKRFFDSRVKRIYELEAIDSFLVTNGYTSKADVRYFTTISDFWQYGNTPWRNTGKRVSFFVSPGYSYQNFQNDPMNDFYKDSEETTKWIDIRTGIDCKIEKPIDLKWQSSFSCIGLFGFYKGDSEYDYSSEKTDFKSPYVYGNANHRIGFYPNTRTSCSFYYGVSYLQCFDKSDKEDKVESIEGNGITSHCGLNINYYISPKFRLQFDSSLGYYFEKQKIGHFSVSQFYSYNDDFSFWSSYDYDRHKEFRQLNFSFSIKLQYSIF